jgi:hypothetical protein
MEITGKIIEVMPYRQGVSNNGEWMTQDYVIEYADGNYNRKMVFTIFGKDKIEKTALREGEVVTVHFDIDARQYANKWYNSIKAWKVDRADDAATLPQQSGTQTTQYQQPQQQAQFTNDDPFTAQPQEGELPF